MKKVIIIGSNGMAGHVIYHYMKENTDFTIVDIAKGIASHIPTYQIDVTDFKVLKDIIDLEKPQYVINCIGVLNRDAEDNPDKSILLNSYFPHYLAKIGAELNFKLIHISTDCVFNGQKGNYTEDSIKDGQGFYAQSKAVGEITYGNHITLRTSIIGPELKKEGIGLFHWFMHQNGKIKGYTNALWTGITTTELAKVIIAAINENISGLHHVVSKEKINKFDLLCLIQKAFDKTHIEIEKFEAYKVDKSLIKTKLNFNYTVSSYPTMLKEMKVWIENHYDLYKHY